MPSPPASPLSTLPNHPSSASPAVLTASASLETYLDLPSLTSSLESVGGHLHRAYLSTAAFPELHVAVQHSAFVLARLGDKSTSVVQSFLRAADGALGDLDVVHALVADGMEDAALDTLRNCGGGASAASAAARAKALACDFADAAQEVEGLLGRVVGVRERQRERLAEVRREWETFGVLLAAAVNGKEACEEGFAEAHGLYEEAVKKEAFAGMKKNALHLVQAATVVSGMLSARPGWHVLGMGGVAALANVFEGEAIRAREEKGVYLHERQKQRMSRLDFGKEVATISGKLRSIRKEEQVTEATVASLEEALAGLRTLTGVTMKTESFWEQVDSTLNRTDTLALEKAIENSRSLTDAEKVELWTSESFKRRAVSVYSPWVALQNVCGIYLRKMSETRSGLYGFLEATEQSSQGALATITDKRR